MWSCDPLVLRASCEAGDRDIELYIEFKQYDDKHTSTYSRRILFAIHNLFRAEKELKDDVRLQCFTGSRAM